MERFYANKPNDKPEDNVRPGSARPNATKNEAGWNSIIGKKIIKCRHKYKIIQFRIIPDYIQLQDLK